MLRNLSLILILTGLSAGAWLWMDDLTPTKIGGEAVTFFDSHGNWETLCDQLPEQPETARCYVRLVDVYSHRPDFGAYIGFITGSGPVSDFEISLEPGSIMVDHGFRLVAEQNTIWQVDLALCSGNVCRLNDEALTAMVRAADQAEQFEIQFVDRKGKRWQRTLSVSDFLSAHRSFTHQMAKI